MSNDQLVAELAETARRAAQTLRASSYEVRKKALLAIASELDAARSEILVANSEDVTRERAAGLSESLLDRLILNESRID